MNDGFKSVFIYFVTHHSIHLVGFIGLLLDVVVFIQKLDNLNNQFVLDFQKVIAQFFSIGCHKLVLKKQLDAFEQVDSDFVEI